jgi:hypothetical protein
LHTHRYAPVPDDAPKPAPALCGYRYGPAHHGTCNQTRELHTGIGGAISHDFIEPVAPAPSDAPPDGIEVFSFGLKEPAPSATRMSDEEFTAEGVRVAENYGPDSRRAVLYREARRARESEAALRKLVEEAPHDPRCHVSVSHEGDRCCRKAVTGEACCGCDCWKSAALKIGGPR